MFYKPIQTRINETPAIIYPCDGIEFGFNRGQEGVIEKYLTELYSENNLNKNGEYNIIILWNDNKDIMTDLWIYDKYDLWGCGGLVDVKNFRQMKIETKCGVTAGHGLILLGKEAERRVGAKSLDDYLNGERPNLPKMITNNNKFYINLH